MGEWRKSSRIYWGLLAATLWAVGNGHAALNLISFDTQNLSTTVATNTFVKSLQAGDVAVLAVAGNKKDSVTPVVFSSTAGALATINTAATDPFPTAYTAYQAIPSNGIYTLTAVYVGTNGLTGKTGLYILRAGSGAITMLASATFVNSDGNSTATQTLSYAWDGSVQTGFIVEAISSRTATVTPQNVSIDANGSNFRLLCSTSFVGSTFASAHAFTGGTANQKTSSGVGLVFVEGAGTPLPTNRVSPYAGTNVLFIALDDFKPLTGAYGDPHALTPNMDRLSSWGTTFFNAQCQWAVCGPSRASLTLGLMPEETGVLGFKKIRGDAVDPSDSNTVLRANCVTLPQYFRYNGYRTAAVGKIHDFRTVGTLNTNTMKVADDGEVVDDPPSWGEPVDPLNLPATFFSASSYQDTATGFDPAGKPTTYITNLPDSAFGDGIVCDTAISLLNSLATNDTQFFLGVGFKKPHLPFVAPQSYWDLYTRSNFVIHPFQQHPLHEVSYTWNYANELTEYDDIAVPTNVPPEKQLELIHGYYACVSFVDALVGRLLDELETLGLKSNTIVVLWGDHGFHLGDHAEWAKHTNLEQASRVPMIIYNPFGGISNQVSHTPVGFTDLYPTLCDLAGLPIPQQPLNQYEAPTAPAAGRSLKGKSLEGIINGTTNSVRTGAITLFRRGAFGYAYRSDRYRYIEWIQSGSVVARELYDYVDDPMETINLAGEPDYDALMYQYSVAMRAEMDAYKLSPTDTAAPILQNSPALNTITSAPVLPISGYSSGAIYWPSAGGATYALMSTTNLMGGPWTTNLAGIAVGTTTLPRTRPSEYFRIQLQ